MRAQMAEPDVVEELLEAVEEDVGEETDAEVADESPYKVLVHNDDVTGVIRDSGDL